tara:strand:+ start:166 stop:399 length:234 start_codon:yes stop_codon:yes gene_type:complete
MAKFKYKLKEIKPVTGTTVYDTREWTEIPDTYQEMNEMSLHKLIKKLDPKKWFYVSYVNKKSNDVDKIVFAGHYKCV